jgi:stage IV sporulation protein FB
MKIKIQTITYIYLILILVSGYFYEMTFFYISLLVHECGHLFMILLFHKKINTLEISPIGGILFIEGMENDHNYKEFLIYLGGPLFSAILFLLVNQYSQSELFWNASFYILVLNLIPVLPLDGARLLGSLLHNVCWYKLTYWINLILSFVILGGLYFFFKGNYIYTTLITFFIYKNGLEIKNMKYHYHHFRMIKYLYPNPKLNIKVIQRNYFERMFKGYNNYYYYNQDLVPEEKMLKKLLNSNID